MMKSIRLGYKKEKLTEQKKKENMIALIKLKLILYLCE